jgi:hypothetical protein
MVRQVATVLVEHTERLALIIREIAAQLSQDAAWMERIGPYAIFLLPHVEADREQDIAVFDWA